INTLVTLEKRLPTLPPQQALLVLADLVPAVRPRLAAMSAEQVAGELRGQLNPLRAEAEAQQRRALAQAQREGMTSAGKYLLSGLITAVLLLLIFENTRPAREARVFSHEGNAPNLRLEEAVARGVGKSVRAIENFGDLILPDLGSFRWYRRLRRWLR